MNRLLSFRQLTFSAIALTILGLCLTASAAPPVPFRGRGLGGYRRRRLAAGQSSADRVCHWPGHASGPLPRTETLIVNLSDGTFTGTLEFTAANGDQLNADVEGHFTSPTGESAEGTYLFTGGTGRFQNASGQAAFEVTPDGMNFDVTFNGTIQY